MPLLSGMFRSQAIYGDTHTFGARLAGRQGGRWAQQTVQAAMAPSHHAAAAPPPDPAKSLATLNDLHRRGVVTDAEFESLRAGIAR